MTVKAATPGRGIIPYVSYAKSFPAPFIKKEKQQKEEEGKKK